MDFWRILRLVKRRIWLILGLALIAAVAVVLGTLVMWQRAGVVSQAVLSPQEAPPMPNVTGTQSGEPVMSNSVADTNQRISNLVAFLRKGNDLYLKTAELLRLDEASRAKEVNEILERNSYFATSDREVVKWVDQRIESGEAIKDETGHTLSREEAIKKVAKQRREAIAASLAAPKDKQGTFAPGGLTLDPNEIADIIREKIEVSMVFSDLDTEQQRQVNNQILLTGKFSREAEANLYLNMLCVALINDYALRSASTSDVHIAELTKQRAVLVKKRQEASDALIAFKNIDEFHSLLNTGPDSSGQNVQNLEAELTRLRAEYYSAQATFNALQARQGENQKTYTITTTPRENPAFREAEAKYNEAFRNFEALKATKGENDPDYKLAQENLRSARSILSAAKKTASQQTMPNPNYFSDQAQLKAASAAVASTKNKLQPFEQLYAKQRRRLSASPKLLSEYSRLVLAVDQAEKAFNAVEQALQREQLGAVQSGRSGTIVIASRAFSLPSKNTPTSLVKMVLYALVLALILGIAIVVAMDALDNAVRTRHDAEELFALPVAGEIPTQLPDPRRAPRISYLDPLSSTAESYRLLRTDILFTAIEHPFRSLLVTTCKPGHGATTTVANLAITLAQSGKKVILVDANLRYPSLHDVFVGKNEVGLSTLLSSNTIAIDEALQQTDIENLLLLSAGPVPLNPSELIGSNQMRSLHDKLKAVSDVVLFDAPSAIAFSDTIVLASFVDATLLVVRAGDVLRNTVQHVKSLLIKARANLIGVVLNGTPSDEVDSVHYASRHYSRPANRPKVLTELPPSDDYDLIDTNHTTTVLEDNPPQLSLTHNWEDMSDVELPKPTSKRTVETPVVEPPISVVQPQPTVVQTPLTVVEEKAIVIEPTPTVVTEPKTKPTVTISSDDDIVFGLDDDDEEIEYEDDLALDDYDLDDDDLDEDDFDEDEGVGIRRRRQRPGFLARLFGRNKS